MIGTAAQWNCCTQHHDLLGHCGARLDLYSARTVDNDDLNTTQFCHFMTIADAASDTFDAMFDDRRSRCLPPCSCTHHHSIPTATTLHPTAPHRSPARRHRPAAAAAAMAAEDDGNCQCGETCNMDSRTIGL
jgi:hypothetical protein